MEEDGRSYGGKVAPARRVVKRIGGTPYDRPGGRQQEHGGPRQRAGRATNPRVFVGNLGYRVSWQDLKDHCGRAGHVVHAEILRFPDGRSKGAGIVVFDSPDSAANALASLQNDELGGRPIFLREDREQRGFAQADRREAGPAHAAVCPRRPRPDPTRTRTRPDPPQPRPFALTPHRNARIAPHAAQPGGNPGAPRGPRVDMSAAEPRSRVFVQNLPWSVTWSDLKSMCDTYGTVLRTDVQQDELGRSRGCGTVAFSTAAAAAAAIDALDGSELEGRKLIARLDQRERCKLHVGNLPYSATWADLKDHFAAYGPVIRTEVATEPVSRRSRGFGTVLFADAEAAAAALKAAHNSEFRGRELLVKYDEY